MSAPGKEIKLVLKSGKSERLVGLKLQKYDDKMLSNHLIP
jgi:hypothetical protein